MKSAAFLQWSLGLGLLASAANAQDPPSTLRASVSIWDDGAFLIAIGVLAIAGMAALGILVSKVMEVGGGFGRDPETRQLHFAAVTLSGLGLLFLLSMAMYYWSSNTNGPAKEIFDSSKTIIPPIVTLVLGYYFGKRSN